MNYIVIDTKEGSWFTANSRDKIETFTAGEVTNNMLKNLFAIEREKRPKKKTFNNGRFVVLPCKDRNKVYSDPELIGKIIAYS